MPSIRRRRQDGKRRTQPANQFFDRLLGDGFADVQDLVEVILNWGTADRDADIDDSGLVDVVDLVEVVLNWGPC